jgi:DNA polymerase (family X)
VRVALNPDAHTTVEYLNLRYGIGAARKGWLTKADVINTLSYEEILAFFRSRRR